MVLEALYEQDFHDCSYGFPAEPIGAPGAGRFVVQTMATQGAGS